MTWPVSTWSPSETPTSVTVPARPVLDGVLHLHGLEDDQELAGLDHVTRRDRDPDHPCPAWGRAEPSASRSAVTG